MKILIVDDSTIIRRVIQGYASKYSLEIVGEAGDGRTALALFETKRPDVVTLDITMPEMDGLECLEAMMKTGIEAKIFVITALNDEATGLKALKMGATDVMNKPFTSEDFDQLMTHLQ